MSTPVEIAQAHQERFDHSQGPRKVGPDEGGPFSLASINVRFMAWGAETGGGFSLVEHPMPPRALAAPMHRHSHEDEYSYVLEGRMGAVLGDDVVHAEAGDFVFKPRDQWHSFWNAGDERCSILEIIAPAGFENFFAELATAFESGALPDMADLSQRYGIDFQPETVDDLCNEHGLTHPLQGQGPPPAA
jgi:mannose-6-phosphate isomerase-like protein (cupin superfamily)